jgi:hypothetical protein
MAVKINSIIPLLIKNITAIAIYLSTVGMFAQTDSLPSNQYWRKPFVYSSIAGLATGSTIGLYYLWYAQSPQTNFHFFNDINHWGGMDKLGHASSSYFIGLGAHKSLLWSGMKPKNALWIGGTAGFAYLTIIEIMDGISKNWGFSPADVAANALGSALYIGQELLWKEQRISPKFSFWPSNFAGLRPEVLGATLPEQFLKDYNAQTYWLSINPYAFSKKKNNTLPKWLNVSLGYSINGYLGATHNFENEQIPRFSRWFISPDINWTQIHTRSKVLKTCFQLFNLIKFPAPTLEINSAPNENIRFHWLFF